MSSKSIFIIALVAFISTTSTCKLDIKTLCETVKADLNITIDISPKCTCAASKTICDALDKGAPYNFITLCPIVGTSLIGVAPTCSCQVFNQTCMKIDECNAAHASSMTISIMPSSSSTVAMESSTMMFNKTGEDMMSTTMTATSSMSASVMPEPTSTSSMMMMSSSSVNGTNDHHDSSANQIQIGRVAVSFCTLMAVLFYYMM